MPCGDIDDCNEHKHEQTSQNKEHKDESCPPICHCACCGTTFVVNVSVQMAINKIEIIQAHSIYSTKMPTSIPSSIWQPPKIV